MRRTLLIVLLALSPLSLHAKRVLVYGGGGLAMPLKPQAYADIHNPAFGGEFGAAFFTNDVLAIGADLGLASFSINQDKLGWPKGYTISGGDDSVTYYDVQLRLQNRVRPGVGGFAFMGIGLFNQVVSDYTVSLNGAKLYTVTGKAVDPARIGVFGAGLHFANLGPVSFYTQFKLIATTADTDSARLTQVSLGMMF